ncbi:hypothetical protein [Methanobrevibacter sp.]|uniref:hypothetical protein n=1 Tax=Methanobrevibacter sp. TaxID=66852 RepID=UPI0025D7C191|nr:hypothetical protein [Methanobrevibacter sp.]MBQ2962732.1 hypothetical protein [Methanobrevibacter sp.]
MTTKYFAKNVVDKPIKEKNPKIIKQKSIKDIKFDTGRYRTNTTRIKKSIPLDI